MKNVKFATELGLEIKNHQISKEKRFRSLPRPIPHPTPSPSAVENVFFFLTQNYLKYFLYKYLLTFDDDFLCLYMAVVM